MAQGRVTASEMDAIKAIEKSLDVTTYRNEYEAKNAYDSNMERIVNLEKSLQTRLHGEVSTDDEKAVLTKLLNLKDGWVNKKMRREKAKEEQEAMLNTDAQKEEWLKQLKEETEAHEKESQKHHEQKVANKKKRAQERREKRNQRRGGGGSDSDSDEDGEKGRGNKGRHGGMERGSSLLAQLAGVEPEGPEGEGGDSDEEGEQRGGQQKKGGKTTASPTSGGPSTTGGVSPLVFYRNVPMSLIPKKLLEYHQPVHGEGVDEKEEEEDAEGAHVVCHVNHIPNSPQVEVVFTVRHHGDLPAPRRVIALSHHQQQQIHQPHYKATTTTTTTGSSSSKKKKGGAKDDQIQFSDIPLPSEGENGFVVKATLWRVVVAAHLTEIRPVATTPIPEALREHMEQEALKSSLVPGKKKKKVGGNNDDDDSEEEEDDDEMLLQHTPDDVDEHIAMISAAVGAVDDDEDSEEERSSKKKNNKKSVLDELSSQLVAQYHEDEAAEEEDDYLRHAKARDIPTTLAKSLVHWHGLSESTWVVLMCHGGHFAGAVFVNGKAILHKAFHRYVVRKKQGGKQSKHLKGGGSMNSIGGQIRHAHELKWKSEVRDIILMWKEHIQKAAMILYVAPGPDNRAILTDWKETPHSQLSRNLGPLALNSPIQLKDSRVRGVPFTTKRPTFAEVTNIYETLSCCSVGFYKADGTEGGAYTGNRNHGHAVDLPNEQGAFYF